MTTGKLWMHCLNYGKQGHCHYVNLKGFFTVNIPVRQIKVGTMKSLPLIGKLP